MDTGLAGTRNEAGPEVEHGLVEVDVEDLVPCAVESLPAKMEAYYIVSESEGRYEGTS